jgi:hypothetical protein
MARFTATRCSICGAALSSGDHAAQVDHMYTKHQAKSDEHAKQMVSIHVEEVDTCERLTLDG